MTEKEIFMAGVQTILDELKEKGNREGTYMDGLLAGIEIGVSISSRFDNESGQLEKGEDSVSETETMTVANETAADRKRTPKYHRRYRRYDEEDRKNIVREVFENGFDYEAVRLRHKILGKGTIRKWMFMYAEELGLDINEFIHFQDLKNQKIDSEEHKK